MVLTYYHRQIKEDLAKIDIDVACQTGTTSSDNFLHIGCSCTKNEDIIVNIMRGYSEDTVIENQEECCLSHVPNAISTLTGTTSPDDFLHIGCACTKNKDIVGSVPRR